jgi:hypothetical protein
MGKDGRHCVLTLVERMTRWTRIVKLPARQAQEVNKALAREIVCVRPTRLAVEVSGDNDGVQLTNSWTAWKPKTVASAGATAAS